MENPGSTPGMAAETCRAVNFIFILLILIMSHLSKGLFILIKIANIKKPPQVVFEYMLIIVENTVCGSRKYLLVLPPQKGLEFHGWVGSSL